ncbi:MAG TPA: hypothetical protein VK636_01145, partial [Gemmatimonadaceae bacterium]|nr:hypothetical protein [Gemmatimonadaceae bacterium]
MGTTRRITTVMACSAIALAPFRAEAQGTLADYRRAADVNRRLNGLTVNVAQLPTWTGPTQFSY